MFLGKGGLVVICIYIYYSSVILMILEWIFQIFCQCLITWQKLKFFLYLSGTKKVKITWLITGSNPADINRFRGPLSLNIMLMLLIVGVY